jgi:hypothetical protein
MAHPQNAGANSPCGGHQRSQQYACQWTANLFRSVHVHSGPVPDLPQCGKTPGPIPTRRSGDGSLMSIHGKKSRAHAREDPAPPRPERMLNVCRRLGATLRANTVVDLSDGSTVNFLYEVDGLRGFEYEYQHAKRVRLQATRRQLPKQALAALRRLGKQT